jgi:hypothetical protein
MYPHIAEHPRFSYAAKAENVFHTLHIGKLDCHIADGREQRQRVGKVSSKDCRPVARPP